MTVKEFLRHPRSGGISTPQQRADVIIAMTAADIGTLFDLVLRYVLISAAGLVLYVVTGQVMMLGWLAAYLLLNSAYSYALWRTRAPVSARRFRMLVVANMGVSCTYASLPLYLWTLEDPALRMIGICGMIGHAVFNMSRHTARSPIALWDSLSIVACILFIGIYQLSQSHPEPAAQLVVGLGTVATAVYYVTGQWGVIRAREQLTEALQANAQAGKMKAVGQLTSGISHDFNNLLTVIGGNIELAELAEDPAERAVLLREARAASDRAARLTSQLLAFSRKARLQTKDIEVAPFAHRLHSTLTRMLPASIDVDITVKPMMQTLHCDPTLLESARLNLSINARDAMQGRGSLAITFAPAPDTAAPLAGIEVRDTGPGIPPHLISQVTEPFFTTKTVGKGSGLGLSMVAGFAEQSGGQMSLSSAADGTVVMLLLPTARPALK